MEPINLFKELKLNDPHKFVLYISGILFIMSFFFNPLEVQIRDLRYSSLIFMIASLILWGIQQYLDWDIGSRIEEMTEDKYFANEIKREIKPKLINWYTSLGIIYFFALILTLLLIL